MGSSENVCGSFNAWIIYHCLMSLLTQCPYNSQALHLRMRHISTHNYDTPALYLWKVGS
jgi:hypothetical protein